MGEGSQSKNVRVRAGGREWKRRTTVRRTRGGGGESRRGEKQTYITCVVPTLAEEFERRLRSAGKGPVGESRTTAAKLMVLLVPHFSISPTARVPFSLFLSLFLSPAVVALSFSRFAFRVRSPTWRYWNDRRITDK